MLRRRAAALRSVPSSSDAFAEPPAPLIILKTSGLDRRGSWPRRLFFSIIIEDGAASANVHSVSSCLEFRLVPALVQVGSEFLEKTHRKAQTRIPCIAVLNFKWFLEGGSEVVQGGSYISHLPPIHKSVQTVRGFLANQGGVGSMHTARNNLRPLADAHAGLCVSLALHPGVLKSHVAVRAKSFPRT